LGSKATLGSPYAWVDPDDMLINRVFNYYHN